jgi:hypothetical protein
MEATVTNCQKPEVVTATLKTKDYYQCAEIPKPWPDSVPVTMHRIFIDLPFAAPAE